MIFQIRQTASTMVTKIKICEAVGTGQLKKMTNLIALCSPNSKTIWSWNINIEWTTQDDLTENPAETFFHFTETALTHKTCEMTKIQNCTLQLDKKTVSVDFRQRACLDWDLRQIFKSIWRSNTWMDPIDFFFLLYQFLFYFLQVKLFLPWIACFN